MELCTTRLLLRPFELHDAPAVYALSREETLRRRMPDQVYETLEEAGKVVTYLKSKAEAGNWPFVLGIALAQTGELIGHIGLSPVEDMVEIGYAIGMAHQGMGYAAEAVTAFSSWAVKKFTLTGIWGILMADNIASRKVLEKAGYTLGWKREMEAFGGRHQCLGYRYTQEKYACSSP